MACFAKVVLAVPLIVGPILAFLVHAWHQDSQYHFIEEAFGNATFAIAVFSRFPLDLDHNMLDTSRLLSTAVAATHLEYALLAAAASVLERGAHRYSPTATNVELHMFIRNDEDTADGHGFLVDAESLQAAQGLALQASLQVSKTNGHVRSGEYAVRAVQLGPAPAVVGRLPWNIWTNIFFLVKLLGYPLDEFLSIVQRHEGYSSLTEGYSSSTQNNYDDTQFSRTRVQVGNKYGSESLHYYNLVSEHKAEEKRYMQDIFNTNPPVAADL